MAGNWSVGLDTLRVDNADEDNIGSDGDEIYVVAIAFRSKLGVPGSTKTWTNSWATYDWAKHVDQGDVRGIPANIGRVQFDAVTKFGFNEFVAIRKGDPDPALRAEVLGIVSLAFESDKSSWGQMHSIIDKAGPVIHDELEKIIANETTPLDKLTAQMLSDKVKGSAAKIKDAITPSVLNKIKLFLTSLGDPDDFVDYGINWFTNFDPDFVICFQALKESKDAHDSGKPAPTDKSHKAVIERSGLHPLEPGAFKNVYHNKGVQYSVDGSVKGG